MEDMLGAAGCNRTATGPAHESGASAGAAPGDHENRRRFCRVVHGFRRRVASPRTKTSRATIPRMRRLLAFVLVVSASAASSAQGPAGIDWKAVDGETLKHFQAVVQIDSTDPPTTPPGVEKPVVDYLRTTLESAGIPTQTFAVEANRPNLVARLKGTGRKRPLLLMAHTDTVNIDAAKWTHPPFSAHRQDGYIYGRGTVDDKDNVTATLMTLLLLKRQNVQLDRDVIALFEAGEEGAVRFGIQLMANQHFAEIDAEFCLAEGGSLNRQGGKVTFASVQTLEKIPRAITLTARGTAGHGSVPLRSNAVVKLSSAVAAVAKWKPPISFNETTAAYFKRLATIADPAAAERYRAILGTDPKAKDAADEYFLDNEPRHASTIRTSISPTMIQAGYRTNVIPSQVSATLDVRMMPDQDPDAFLEMVKKVVNDPAVEATYGARDVRPGGTSRLNTDAFTAIEANMKKHYDVITLPTMSTGATDMAYLRAKGVQCYGVGPAVDIEDGPKGFGAHSDQERINEAELYRFVRAFHDIVVDLARAQ
jgi:acetylornithine deacetylase/succinyl-diaminopimelate desuccinylase-like protein